jgi:hypothetical protein
MPHARRSNELTQPRKIIHQGRTRHYQLTLVLNTDRDADLIKAIESTPKGQLAGRIREMMRTGLKPDVVFNGSHAPDVQLDGIGGDI